MKAAFRRLMRPLLELQVRRLIAAKRLRVVAVAGAIGKTSTKLAIAAVLKQKYSVLVHPGNFNADISLPLAIFELPIPKPIINPFGWLRGLINMERTIRGRYPYDVLVLELGTDHPGEIPRFMSYLHPEIGVVTAVAPEHMEYFGTLDAVAAEELALVAGSHIAVVNRDDVAAEYWDRYVVPHPRHHSYGLHRDYDYSASVQRSDPTTGLTVNLFHAQKSALSPGLVIHRYGEHSARAVAAAYAVGDLMGLSSRQLEAGLRAIEPVSGRMQPLRGRGGSQLIDDTYNSSPEAAVAALAALAAAPARGRRIAVMGSMNELGPDSPHYHAEVGAQATDLDLLVTVGADANAHLGPAAVAAGLPRDHWRPFDSPYAAGAWLRTQLDAADIVLAKGSQNGVFAEEALKPLLADPADAAKLVRQSSHWLAEKAKQFPDATHSSQTS